LTDLVKGHIGGDQLLRMSDRDRDRLRESIEKYTPATVAFTSKKACSLFLGIPTSLSVCP